MAARSVGEEAERVPELAGLADLASQTHWPASSGEPLVRTLQPFLETIHQVAHAHGLGDRNPLGTNERWLFQLTSTMAALYGP